MELCFLLWYGRTNVKSTFVGLEVSFVIVADLIGLRPFFLLSTLSKLKWLIKNGMVEKTGRGIPG